MSVVERRSNVPQVVEGQGWQTERAHSMSQNNTTRNSTTSFLVSFAARGLPLPNTVLTFGLSSTRSLGPLSSDELLKFVVLGC
jgi:hypothetical protein